MNLRTHMRDSGTATAPNTCLPKYPLTLCVLYSTRDLHTGNTSSSWVNTKKEACKKQTDGYK